MKNKKILTITIVLIGLLLLGIGYAATTDDFSITGTASASVDASHFKVGFDTTKTATGTEGKVTASITDVDTASLTVTGLTAKGQSVTATYPVINTSADLNASLAVGQITNDNEGFFDVKAEFDSTTINAVNGTTNLVVTVTLNKTPIGEEGENLTANITIPLKATAVQQ